MKHSNSIHSTCKYTITKMYTTKSMHRHTHKTVNKQQTNRHTYTTATALMTEHNKRSKHPCRSSPTVPILDRFTSTVHRVQAHTSYTPYTHRVIFGHKSGRILVNQKTLDADKSVRLRFQRGVWLTD